LRFARCDMSRRLRPGVQRRRIRHRNHLPFIPSKNTKSMNSAVTTDSGYRLRNRFARGRIWLGVRIVLRTVISGQFSANSQALTGVPVKREGPAGGVAGQEQATLSRSTRSFGRSTAQSRTDAEEQADMHNGKFKHRSRAETVSIQRNRTPNCRVRRRI